MVDWPQPTGVPSSSRSSSAEPGVLSASHRSAASISGATPLSRWLYSLWPAGGGTGAPPGWARPAASGARRVAQQHLGDGQADQLGVGHLQWTTWAAAAEPKGRDDPVGEFHVQCDQKGVQVGDHEDLHGLTCVNTPILGTLRFYANPVPPAPSCTELPVNDLGVVGRQFALIQQPGLGNPTDSTHRLHHSGRCRKAAAGRRPLETRR
jgi:hypothetical protein